MLSLHVFWTWCIERFRNCRWSETRTFGAGYICDAFWFRETCRDPPFTAERPFLTEADAENEHGSASFVTGRRRTLESRAEGQHMPNPTCVYISALPGCWSRDFPSVHEHSENDFFFSLFITKKVKSQMVLTEDKLSQGTSSSHR